MARQNPFAILFVYIEIIAQLQCGELDCPQGVRHRSLSRAYYPDLKFGGHLDMGGNKLNSVQEFIMGQVKYASLSLDSQLGIPLGTPICILEINRKFNQNVIFQFRDTGTDLQGKGYTSCHICVFNETFVNEKIFNQYLTLVVPQLAL